jgi:hypothetical protein
LTWDYVAYHHFAPSTLKADGSGPIETVEISKALNHGLPHTEVERIRIEGPKSSGGFIVPPCYSWPDVVRNFHRAGGCSTLVSVEESTDHDTTPMARLMGEARTEPQARHIKAIENKIKGNPVGFALEYQKLEDALQRAKLALKKCSKDNNDLRSNFLTTALDLQMALKMQQQLDCLGRIGLPRSNLISDRWHKINKFATAHLFGGVYQDWDCFKEMTTMAYFLGMVVAGGGGIDNKITEFEKMMMAMMRAYRGYKYETIGLIFGEDRRRIGEYVTEYDDQLGKLGLYLSDNDVDLTHDYVSKEKVLELNLPHFEILEIHEKTS